MGTEDMPTKVNGKKQKQKQKLPDSDSDDLEVLEVSSASKSKPKPFKSKQNGNKVPALLPISSTRTEIKTFNRLPQSTISQFFSPPKNKGSNDKKNLNSKVNNKVNNNVSDKDECKIEENDIGKEKKKGDKQETPSIKWKKVTNTRDTALPSDKSDISESEGSDDDNYDDTIEVSSQEEINQAESSNKKGTTCEIR